MISGAHLEVYLALHKKYDVLEDCDAILKTTKTNMQWYDGMPQIIAGDFNEIDLQALLDYLRSSEYRPAGASIDLLLLLADRKHRARVYSELIRTEVGELKISAERLESARNSLILE